MVRLMSLLPVSTVSDGREPGLGPEGVSSAPLLFIGANTVPVAVVYLMSGATIPSTRESNFMRRSSCHLPSPNVKLVRLCRSTSGCALKVFLRLDLATFKEELVVLGHIYRACHVPFKHVGGGGELPHTPYRRGSLDTRAMPPPLASSSLVAI